MVMAQVYFGHVWELVLLVTLIVVIFVGWMLVRFVLEFIRGATGTNSSSPDERS